MDLPKNTLSTAQLIYSWHESQSEEVRGYLGASSIGKKCTRMLWYSFHWCTTRKIEGRILRLFKTGHYEEARVIHELKSAGVTCHELDPSTGKQWAVKALGGHFKGHADLVALGLPEDKDNWNLVDVKTIKSTKFNQLLKEGIEVMYPEYYGQGMVYMGLLGLTKAQFIFVNKDTDEIHVERFHFKETVFQALMDKAKTIVEAQTPPPKISEDPAYWECKYCDHWDLCHQAKLPNVNCRTCAHSTAQLSGGWSCDIAGGELIPDEVQPQALDCHVYHPVFFVGKSVDKFEDDTVFYQDGIKNGKAGMTSQALKELVKNGAESIAKDGVLDGMGATVQKAWKK